MVRKINADENEQTEETPVENVENQEKVEPVTMNLTETLDSVNKEIEKLQEGTLSLREKGQVRNLKNKISDRKQMPNFISTVGTAQITFLEFLDGINTETPEEDSVKIKELMKKKVSLEMLLGIN